jgi:hypothetical protein
MTPTPYDIGVGRCSAIEGDMVYVRLDALIAKRLAPDAPWNRSGTSVLRCGRAFCSQRRPPKEGEEVYLDSAALARAVPAEIDVLGNDRFRPVDLSIVLSAMAPIRAAPTPSAKLPFMRRGK